MISRSIGCIQRGIAAGRRIFNLLDEKSELKNFLGKRIHTTFKGEFVLKTFLLLIMIAERFYIRSILRFKKAKQ